MMDEKVEMALIDVLDALEQITFVFKEKLQLTRDVPEFDQLIASVEGLASTLKTDNSKDFQKIANEAGVCGQCGLQTELGKKLCEECESIGN